MSVSHCMHRALEIAKMPRPECKAQIEALPVACAHSDCGQPKSCRERIADYLRMQWRMAEQRARQRGVVA